MHPRDLVFVASAGMIVYGAATWNESLAWVAAGSFGALLWIALAVRANGK